MAFSILVNDVLALPCIANSVVAAAIIDPKTSLTHTDFSTDASANTSETFSLTGTGGSDHSSGVWVGPRMFDYQVEALLPTLKLRGTSLVVLAYTPLDDEPWRRQISAATDELAKRLGVSIAILRSRESPTALAAEVEQLLRQNQSRQAKAILDLSALATSKTPVTPEIVGQELVGAIGAPVAVLGADEVVIWRSQPPPDTYSHRLSAPIGPGGVARIDAHLREPSPSATAFVTPLLSIGGLLLTQWYFDQREATLQARGARTSLLSELAAVKGRVPGTLISLASSVRWPLDGWHVVISTRTRSHDDGIEDGLIVAGALQAKGFPARAAQHHDHWVVCCTQPRQPTRDDYSGLVHALEESFANRKAATVFGVSRPRLGPDGFVRNLAEAEDLARRGGKGRVRRTRVNSRESEAARLVQSAVSDPGLLNPAETLLANLVLPENEQLLQTLTAYLDLESNLSRTARRLEVHRNTVIGRITRIEDMLNASLDEPDVRLALRIAIRTLGESTG